MARNYLEVVQEAELERQITIGSALFRQAVKATLQNRQEHTFTFRVKEGEKRGLTGVTLPYERTIQVRVQ